MIETVTETGSTNADLVARLRAGEAVPEGQWLVADRQSAGRGRQGRQWFNGEGNFMGSTVVHLDGGEPAPHTLALVAGLAVYHAVLSQLLTPVRLELKWPNDLLLAGGKLAGILLERVGNAVVIGIGVNLVKAPAITGRSVTSLQQFGSVVDRDGFAQDLAGHFAREVEGWRRSGLSHIIDRWTAAAHPPGTLLSVQTGAEGTIEGRFDGLAADGALCLRLEDGSLRMIHAGDVSLIGGQD
ncbi:biotin--[acetyl-CoA-carboxylase] ligase [Altererythrobacter sp. CC-YST694]|nr:biotin--[acetyl-CoA-carboxylase] ligase [Altererythrobacter sp. CC-YST694]